jgi:hypothetical protein
MALYLIVPGLAPDPSETKRHEPSHDDEELSIDVELDDIETTIRISLDESRRLVDAAFGSPD